MENFYQIKNREIIIKKTTEFDIEHILLCGQIFTFEFKNNCFYIYSKNNIAIVEIIKNSYIIKTNNVDYFVNFFDLNTNYLNIKNEIKNIFYNNNFVYDIDDILKYGSGIRILKQDFIETVVGFAISANNNIKRIINSMKYIRENIGEKLFFDNNQYYSFPTLEVLKKQDEEFFKMAGCGYRAKHIVKLIAQLEHLDFNVLSKLDTQRLKNELIKLSGIGEKVADCILLFCFARKDVFPVDTWIKKVYLDLYNKNDNPIIIRKTLINEFGVLSGYIQQYLFYYKRSKKI